MKKLTQKEHPVISFAARGTLLHEAPALDQWIKGYFQYRKLPLEEAKVEEQVISAIQRLNVHVDEGFQPEDRFPVLSDLLKALIESPSMVDEALEAYKNTVKYVIPKFVIDTCIELKKREFKLCVISNEPSDLVEFLRLYHLLDYFDAIYLADEVGKKKPDPEFFKLACEDLDIPPESLVHIGDQYAFDVVSAQRSSATSILYDPLGWEERASKIEPDSMAKAEKVVDISAARTNRYWSETIVVTKFDEILKCLVN